MGKRRATVFVSYAHRDKRHLDRLLVHLEPLRQTGSQIEPWRDRKIAPGLKWEEEINHAIVSAKVAVLLVSADFLASEFITTRELPQILRLAGRSRTTVLPVIVGHCSFVKHHELTKFQAVNDPARPVNGLPIAERERVWNRVREAVEAALAGHPSQDGWAVVNERNVFEALSVLSTWRWNNGFVIFQMGDVYVQVERHFDDPIFNCEAVSNYYLPESAQLDRSKEKRLRDMGFRLPKDGVHNFERTIRHNRNQTKIRALAKLIVRVFARVYGVSKNANIKVSGGIVNHRSAGSKSYQPPQE